MQRLPESYSDIPTLQTNADQGDTKSCFWLGYAYSYGVGVDQDDTKAAYYWEIAAAKDPAWGSGPLGSAYRDGRGVERDLAAAAHYFEADALSGSPSSARLLGIAYWLGQGVPKDHELAVKWFRKAVTMNPDDSESHLHLGWALGWGSGANTDLSDAAKHLSHAARTSNVEVRALANNALRDVKRARGQGLLGRMFRPHKPKHVGAFDAVPDQQVHGNVHDEGTI